MVDDLVLQGVTEPYRMLTARAEYRLRLRADNADARLTPQAIRIGCVSAERGEKFRASRSARQHVEQLLSAAFNGAELIRRGISVRDDGVRRTLGDWIRFPQVDRAALLGLEPRLGDCAQRVLEEAIQDHIYAPYVERQQAEVARLKADEAIRLPYSLDYSSLPGLSNEMVERLTAARPGTLGAASRVQGITPAALAAILVHARRRAA
jgi:tRNA uridine 5-carboxymethylaminomethyl modification enzyme